ncbi:Glycosyltransferase involved in cell wall bisynthesis [Parapedobacter luteus]|uniref:Glycosyltransferase involved in cell wall bisynthesis n=1 Tax=Parapedobacter luteus TaxID=623280 RepID=A0A1T5DGK8_9SPHI|nr:glycosyltransferase [Parapedobacter luteus]SKB70711.1 Glycosyltransferase involved in cell wall bisynthesis [Parapedobacter luteus]
MNQKKLKVVHLTSVHARYDNRILFKQCVSLSNHGFETTLIVADGHGNEIFKDNLNILDVGSKKGHLHRMSVVCYKIYRLALKLEAQIYQIHDPELILVAYFLFKKGKKIIYDIHEDYRTSILQKKYIWKPARRLIARIYDRIESFAIKRFTILLAEKYYKEFSSKGVTILNYPIISNNDKDCNAPVSETSEHQSNNSKNEQIKLLYTGNVTEARGAFNHSKLVDLSDDIYVTFVGFCSGELASRMLDSIIRVSAIKIIGKDSYVPQTEIQQIYLQNWTAGLALFPKTAHYERKELTKFFEYMLNGIPIICSDFPLWKEFVEKNECGFAVSPNNSAEVYKVIQRLFDDPLLRKKLGHNGKLMVTKYYNWGTQEKKLLAVYNSLTEV